MWGHFELDLRKLQCFACFSGSCFFENYPFFSETLYYACTGFKPCPHQANCFNVQSSRLDGNWCKFTFSPVFSWFWCFLPAKIIVVFVSFFSACWSLELPAWCLGFCHDAWMLLWFSWMWIRVSWACQPMLRCTLALRNSIYVCENICSTYSCQVFGQE